MILSIDPGVRCAGIALWTNDGQLECARLAVGASTASPAWLSVSISDFGLANAVIDDAGIDEIVIERPQVYVRSRSKGDPNDLISVALAVGVIVGELLVEEDPQVFEYLPASWKGQVPKAVMVERIKRSLSKAELARVELPKAKSLAHNVWDAVGIGLHHLRKHRR